MSTGAGLLPVLAVADSGFPSGAVAFSGGLEAAVAAGAVTDEADLAQFVADQVHRRFHTCDRVLLHRWAAAPVAGRSADLDRRVEALLVVQTARRGSRAAGLALLGTYARLQVPVARALHGAALSGRAPGHLLTAQAVCWDADGLALQEIETAACWSLLTQLTSAAVRLGVVGHLGAQRVLRGLRAEVTELLTSAPPADPWTGTPLLDVLLCRPAREGRLFTT